MMCPRKATIINKMLQYYELCSGREVCTMQIMSFGFAIHFFNYPPISGNKNKAIWCHKATSSKYDIVPPRCLEWIPYTGCPNKMF